MYLYVQIRSISYQLQVKFHKCIKHLTNKSTSSWTYPNIKIPSMAKSSEESLLYYEKGVNQE